MNAKLKRLAVTLTITMVFLSFTLTNVKVTFSSGTSGEIDLFTQKDSYNGKGPNMPSDAFGPGEEVKIYALVTYRDSPLEGFLVAFEASGPRDPVSNITIVRTALTNEDGIAMISFRISVLNTTTFGEWMVIGNVKIVDTIFQDTVSFKVGWIVQIVSIRTVNEILIEQTKFTRESLVGIEVVLRNIAMTEKSVTLAITITDHLNILINSTETNNFVVEPNGTLVYAYRSLFIPKNALPGEAFAYASAYTAPVSLGGVPCCPEASTHFLIVNRDIGILNVQPSPTVVFRGDTVKVDVNVKNKGEEIESFNVSTYYNETLISTLSIINLQPGLNTTVSFTWNTSLVVEGFYQISAYASPVPDEIDISDNTFVDGVVEVIKSPKGWFVPDWFYWLLPLLLAVIVLLIVWLYLRKRRKKAGEAFYSGWTAWYYCYDLRSRTRKI